MDWAAHPVGERRNIRIGTCSWTDPSLIKTRRFYPKGCSSAEQRLRFYASQFPLVEVDSGFFGMPSPRNSVLWAERTPRDFRFNVKAFRLLTGHQTPPNAFPADLQPELPPLTGRKRNWYYADVPPPIVDELWRRFKAALEPLRSAGKLQAVHFQFAPWVTGEPKWRSKLKPQKIPSGLLSCPTLPCATACATLPGHDPNLLHSDKAKRRFEAAVQAAAMLRTCGYHLTGASTCCCDVRSALMLVTLKLVLGLHR